MRAPYVGIAMRIATPCSENLPSMPRVPHGVHCSKCDRDVLDLRRVTRKRALAILDEKRASEGRVCAWVWAREDGTPVFHPDPSRLTKLAAPFVATALAACAPAATELHTTAVTLVHETTSGGTSVSGNTNGAPSHVAVMTPYAPPTHPASNVAIPVTMMAGDMTW